MNNVVSPPDLHSVDGEPPAAAGALPGGRGRGPLRPLVVIVDDQVTGRTILEEMMHALDPALLVETYAEPQAALDRVAKTVPDLVLTDYKMPGMNGAQFTRRMRSMPGCSDVPIVVVTVLDDRTVRYEALDAGATDFLTRPIDRIECSARCKNLLTLRKQQKIIRSRARWLEEQVAVATRQIRTREEETLLRLAKAGEYRDEGTGNHVLRMANYSRLLGEEMGLSPGECDELQLAAPMHDIGKIGIPDFILRKPGALTDEEMTVMRTHTSIGYEILKESPSRYIQKGAVIALNHHERYDGTGYPNALQGYEIPIEARIVAVADVFDALTTVRPYKDAWSTDAAVDHILDQAGRHFDPRCVDAFNARLPEIREIQESLRDERD